MQRQNTIISLKFLNQTIVMKKLIAISILSFGFHFILSAQQSEKEIKDLLCHKWKATQMEYRGQKTEMPGTAYLIFKSDSTLEEIDPGETYKGKWSYDHKTQTITTVDRDGNQKHKLIKITSTELTITMTMDDDSPNLILKRDD
jgi:hypothetical protein